MLQSLSWLRESITASPLPKDKLNLVLIQEDLSLSPKEIRRLKADIQELIQRHLTDQATQARRKNGPGGHSYDFAPSDTLTITVSL